jgi:hypothetical protein
VLVQVNGIVREIIISDKTRAGASRQRHGPQAAAAVYTILYTLSYLSYSD